MRVFPPPVGTIRPTLDFSLALRPFSVLSIAISCQLQSGWSVETDPSADAELRLAYYLTTYGGTPLALAIRFISLSRFEVSGGILTSI